MRCVNTEIVTVTVMPNKYRSPRKATEPLSEQIATGTLLLAASRQVVLLGSKAMAKLPIQPPDSDIILLVKAMPGQNQADLANRLKMDGTTFGRRVDRMVSMGFVSRVTDPSDGRAYLLYLTDTGDTLADEIQSIVEQIDEHMGRRMGLRNYRRLSELLAQYLAESEDVVPDRL